MSELPPFKLNSKCPKCGHMEYKYVGIGLYPSVAYKSCTFLHGPGHGTFEEWLERTCPLCGYTWREACVDAEKQE